MPVIVGAGSAISNGNYGIIMFMTVLITIILTTIIE